MRKTILRYLLVGATSFCLQYSVPAFAQNPTGSQAGGPPTSQQTQPGAPNATSPGMNGQIDQPGAMPTKVDDKKFAKEAAVGGLAEVELGKLAQQKASSDAVKQFGQKMVDDHTKANDELKQVASKEGIQIPDALDSKHQSRVDKLGKLSGTAFDRAYVKDQLRDHQEDVRKFQSEAQSGTDPGVKNFAAKTLPILQEHLQMVKDLSKSVGSTSMK